MVITHEKLKIKPTHDNNNFIEVKFLIDSGVVYSVIPAKELKKIDIKPHRTMTFVLADGTEIQRKVGDAYFEWHGSGGAAPVIFGEKDDKPLLGVTALESLGLVLNPFTRKLSPMKMMIA
jgi:clan AA aspartic protease